MVIEGVVPSEVKDEMNAKATRRNELLARLAAADAPAPDHGELRIELKGNVAAMLGATVQTKRSSESDDLSLQVSLVVGGNHRYLQLWSVAPRGETHKYVGERTY
jgi:hypothetical protein